jgi:HAD superfamily hydrolase (TIGR01450 family)
MVNDWLSLSCTDSRRGKAKADDRVNRLRYAKRALQPVPNMRFISSLSEILSGYKAIFCDVWGVVHNGEWSFPEAAVALEKARNAGVAIVLVTNAPRRHDKIAEQLESLGFPRTGYDRLVSSGDATRDLIADGPRRIFHIGADREKTVYEDLGVELCEEFEASGIVCTGLFHDEVETPAGYIEMLRRMRARDLPMICANPDIKVERGRRQVYCAGSIAREYQQMGGRVALAGKPHQPIYDLARREAEAVLGQAVGPQDILAIGDGLLTDVKGAVNCGYDVLYISAGVHAKEYGEHGEPDHGKLTAWLEGHGVAPVATMPMLAW